jgi:Nif-specific regulatory protein
MLAYLVIREGNKWSDVFRLIPGRTVTVGRAPTNEIVIKDERCSRYHAELFMTRDQWTLRDLDSRNGTIVGKDRIKGDYSLKPGDIVRVAHTQMAFVHDLTKAFASESAPRNDGDETVIAAYPPDASLSSSDSGVLDLQHEPTTITHRRNKTKFLASRGADDELSIPKVGRAAAKLCGLAFELAKQPDVLSVASLALDGLFDGTKVDAGAVLLQRQDAAGALAETDLDVIAARSDKRPAYHRISSFLTETVLREGEAVLARNVGDDSTLGGRDSQGDIQATSVICAPIRQDNEVIGLIHLYVTDDAVTPDVDDLEFTLAVAENVALALKNLNRQQKLAEDLFQSQNEIVQLRERLGDESDIIGSSAPMGQVKQEIARAAPSRATVLIRGESGVGKELVARAIHFASPRKNGPFKCLNCAALSESLLESELFGHERGAFTGATERKIGKFEASHEGTLMLDEIGEMSSSIQAKFLRVLEGHPFERVGGSEAIKVDVRVIAATNRDLERDVTKGEFRRDLYFRLRVVEITVPPLRRRPNDVIDLANHFLARFNAETGRRFRGFTPDALQLLQQYRWPGNVRELKNVVERAVVLGRGESIGVEDLALSNLSTSGDSGEINPPPFDKFEPYTLDEMERRHILATLNYCEWNKSRTAGVLGIERSTLDRKIRRYNLGPAEDN